jgi:CheY-like chemotaxis protein
VQKEAALVVPRGGESILVVEDEEVVLKLVRSILERADYRVLTARNGADALRLMEEHREPVHLLLTDVVMPGMSGPQLVERLRERLPALRAVFMSGYAADAMPRPGEAGRTGFIQKPFTAAMLGAKLRQVLAQD